MQRKRPIRDSIQIMKKNWKQIGLIAIFDILFILLLVNLKVAVSSFNSWFYIWIVQPGPWVSIPSLSIGIIIEVLLLVAVYSFFKYLILGNLYGIFKKKDLNFSRFFSFLKLNWIIWVPFTIVYLAVGMLMLYYINKLMNMGDPLALIGIFLLIIVIVIILLIYFYTLLNILHSIFLKETNLRKIIKQSFSRSFKLSSYKIYWHNFKVILISSLVLLLFYSFMKLFVLTSMTAYLRYGGIYRWGLNLIMLITGYFLLLFNRINFYEKYSLHK